MNADRRITDEVFIDRVRERVRGVIDAQPLPPDVAARLAAGRRKAVAAVPDKPLYVPAAWLPVSALAATLLAVVLLRPTTDMDGVAPLLEDEAQVAAVENLDLLENLEFAAWMDASDANDEG
jgi:hypothetical protein